MKYIKLYTGNDNKSHFEEIELDHNNKQPLGNYSQEFPAKGIIFREFDKGALFDWHNAPRVQYIIYLEGEVEVETSSGEKRIFKPGEVLLASDLTGKGHISRTLTKGKSIIVTT